MVVSQREREAMKDEKAHHGAVDTSLNTLYCGGEPE